MPAEEKSVTRSVQKLITDLTVDTKDVAREIEAEIRPVVGRIQTDIKTRFTGIENNGHPALGRATARIGTVACNVRIEAKARMRVIQSKTKRLLANGVRRTIDELQIVLERLEERSS